MSEEFSLHVSFETESQKTLELLKKIETHFDNEDFEAMGELLAGSGIDFNANILQENIKNTFSQYSDHRKYYDGDLVKSLIETAKENNPQLSIEGKKSHKLLIEGHDHGGDDFCTFFMALLSILNLSKLSGIARSDNGWSGKWVSSGGKLSVEFQEAEEW